MAIPQNQMICFEISMRGSIAAGGGSVKPLANVFHYRRLATVVDVSPAAVATAFETDILPTIMAGLNARATITQIGVRCIDDATAAEHVKTVSAAGAIVGDGLANFVCGTIRLRTAVRGRSAQGSKHFSPLSESDGDDDAFTGAGLTRFQAIRDVCDDEFTDSTGNTWRPCVVSKKLSQLIANPTTVVRNDVTSCVLNVTYGSLQRRKVKSVT